MKRFFLDASALGKRYIAEVGSDLVAQLLDGVPADRLTCLTLGVGEVISVINRRANEGRLSRSAAMKSFDALSQEVLQKAEFHKLPMPDEVVVPAFAYIRRHNLNTTDAVVLHAALRMQDALPRVDSLVMVASDDRLLKAARAEGLETFDPERNNQERLEELLAEPPPPELTF